MSIFNNNLLAGAGAQSGTTTYAIDQSIRFNSAEAAFITQDSGGSFSNQSTSTISMWIKRGAYTSSGTRNVFYGAFYGGGGRYDWMQFDSSDRWVFGTRNTDATTADAVAADNHRVTNMVFRDPSAWYHLVLVLDSTNAVDAERIRMYVNGERITSLATSLTIPQNRGFYTMADGVENNIGAYEDNTGYSSHSYFDGYMAEVALIDGTAYDADNFGEYNSSGIWIPKDISELTFGSNGIYYKGQDSSALGDDSSGNGNDGTLRSIAAHDQILDTPTNNFPTLNPISSDGLAAGELTGGNLEMRNIEYIDATMPFPTSGKWYWELCTVSKTQSNWNYGNHYFRDVVDQFPDSNFTDYITTNFYHGSNFYSSSNWTDGDFWTNSNAAAAGDVFGFAWDSDNKKIWLAKNNTYYGSGDPAGNSGTPLGSGGTAGVEYLITMYSTLSQVMTLNFGQDDTFNNSKTSGSAGAADGNGVGKFYYAPPTGFLSLCSKNKGS